MSDIRLLVQTDIPGAVRLSEAAGWNQLAADWERLLHLEPSGCFGIDIDGRLAATATAVCFGSRLGWIGMVLTDPAHRRKGLARRLMEHALTYLDRQRVDWIKLDATEMGLPLYEHLGFKIETPVERWSVIAERGSQPAGWPAVQPWLPTQHAELDQIAFGAGRSRILSHLARGEAAALPDGFAMGRPGANALSFGPCVARNPETARQLAAWFLHRHPRETVFWDLLPDNRSAVELAEHLNFSCRRKLLRMVRRGRAGAAPLLFDNSFVYATAGFEYG